MKITTSKHRGKRRITGTLCVALLLLLAAGTANAGVTDNFKATYSVSYGFVGLGQITFRLQPADKSGCYIYSGHAQPNAVVSMMIGELHDKSRFCITGQDDVLRPQFFRHSEQGAPEDSYTLQFNWEAGTVRYQNHDGNIRVMSLPNKATDPLSLQIAARLWLASSYQPAQLPNRSFNLVDENEIKQYTLAVEHGGTVVVPAGRYDTLIVKRVDDEGETLRFWLAKYADWMPVKVEHEQDGRVVTMEMTSIVHK